MFAVNGLVHMVETSDDVHIRAGGDGTYAEAFSNKVLHFGLQVSAEATWDHFKANEKHLGNGNIYEKTARVRSWLQVFEAWSKSYLSSF